jgi:ceramide glucosyltransferase
MLRGERLKHEKEGKMTCFGVVRTVLALLVVAGVIYNLLAIYCVAEFFAGRPRRPDRVSYPPVSILKPVKGLDPGFRTNIESFCLQDYPEFEVLIGFVGEGDEALPEAREIADAYPGKVGIVTTREKTGVNEKVSNLKGLIGAARYPLVAVSDSDMHVDERYLRTIVEEYLGEENVGMVTSSYGISGPSTAGAAFESLAIAVDFIPSVLVARRLEGISFGLGASMLFSTGALVGTGGLDPISDYLADDYQIGNRLARAGLKILLSRYVIEDIVGDMDIASHLSHQTRWARTYRASRPWGFLGYGITHLFFFACLLLLLQGPTAAVISIVSCALVLRFLLAAVVYRNVIRRRGWLKWLFLLPVRDLMAFGIWAWSFAGRKVFWRGSYYRVDRGGRIRPTGGKG